jgi:beta-glucosidase/6-phospho-beta-glucosidase/beta-galactosidase
MYPRTSHCKLSTLCSDSLRYGSTTVSRHAHADSETYDQTIFDWDVPQALQDKYRGLLSTDNLPGSENHARVCFVSFGDLVKHWFMINGTLREEYAFPPALLNCHAMGA